MARASQRVQGRLSSLGPSFDVILKGLHSGAQLIRHNVVPWCPFSSPGQMFTETVYRHVRVANECGGELY